MCTTLVVFINDTSSPDGQEEGRCSKSSRNPIGRGAAGGGDVGSEEEEARACKEELAGDGKDAS